MTIRWDEHDQDVAYVRSASHEGMVYRIEAARSLHPHCTCPAGMHGRDCKHIAELMESLTQEGKDMPRRTKGPSLRERLGVTDEPEKKEEPKPEQKALALRPTVASRVVAAREALSQTRLGIDDARWVALHLERMWPAELTEAKDQESARKTATLVVMTAAELGISPIQAFSYVTVIKGRPFLMARMVTALVQSRVPGGWIAITKRTPVAVTGRAHRPGRPDVELTITIQQAEKAGWTRNTLYKSNPAAMLTARVKTTLGWDHFSDVLAGMDAYDPETGEQQFAGEAEMFEANVVEGEVTVVEDPPEDSEPMESGFIDEEPTPPEEPTTQAELDPEDVWAEMFLIIGQVSQRQGFDEPLKATHVNSALGLEAKTQPELKAKLTEWASKREGWRADLSDALEVMYSTS